MARRGCGPGVGMISKSPSSRARSEKVSSTGRLSSAAARSSAWMGEWRVDAVAAEGGFVPVVEVLVRRASERLDRRSGGADRGCGVDEQVAGFALEQERADVQRSRERQRIRRGGVEAGERCIEHALNVGSAAAAHHRQLGWSGIKPYAVRVEGYV